MRPFYVSIPHEVELKKGTCWMNSGEFEYFVYREHFFVKERQLPDPARVGEKVAFFQSQPSKGRLFEGSREMEWEVTHVEESITQMLIEREAKEELSAELATEVSKIGLAKFKSKLKTVMEERLKQSTTTTDRTERSTTVRRKVVFSWKYPLPDESSDRWSAAAVYQRYAYDVYLAYADYLFVRYDRPSLFYLRKVRLKFPEIENNRHLNWIKIHQPKCTIALWRLLEGTQISLEKDHKLEIDDPYEVSVQPLQRSLPHTPRPDVETLYSLANRAFPKEWKKYARSLKALREEGGEGPTDEKIA
jgi:hypothetical protein